MPLRHYGVLKGRAIASRLGAGQSPHYQVHIIDDTTDYRIAVNVKSKLSPSDLGYLVDECPTMCCLMVWMRIGETALAKVTLRSGG